MNDPCNLSPQQQAQFVPTLIPAPCQPSYPKTLTTIATDWDDIDAVVDYVRALRHVDKVSTVAWSQGGPRSGGFAAQHPEKINRMVMLAPAYNANGPAAAAGDPCGERRGVQHAVAGRLQRALEASDRLRRPVDRGRARRGLVRDAGVGSGRRDLGHRRAAGADNAVVGMEPGGRCEDRRFRC